MVAVAFLIINIGASVEHTVEFAAVICAASNRYPLGNILYVAQ